MVYKLLVINPGSTSTKVAFCQNSQIVSEVNITHTPKDLEKFDGILDQVDFRYDKIMKFLSENNKSVDDLDAVVARGGLLKPIPSGTYLVNVHMLNDLQEEKYGRHAANLGAILAMQFSKEGNIPAYIVDPVVVDELIPIARVTGRPEYQRVSIFHALNQKAVARRFAHQMNRKYEEMNLIVAHMGGGVSIGTHLNGRVVDVNNALNGEGPMSPERTGTVQGMAFAELINEKKFSLKEVEKILAGDGGVLAHLKTTDMRKVEEMIEAGDEEAILVYESMIYQVAKSIGAAAVIAKGEIDQIILTGGIAHSSILTGKLIDYINFIAPITIMPGEDELKALAEGALRALSGQEVVREYV